MRRYSFVVACLALVVSLVPASPALAQQTGAITGKVTASDGSALPGATVEARSEVLPGPRTTVTGANGEYRLPALPPGNYTVKFDLSGMQSATRKALVQLGQDTVADAKLAVAGVAEEVTVTAEVTLIDKESATIASSLSQDQITSLPVGQDYRDLQKLIPGVQYTEDSTRGASAGGSGQDNVYQFDGVNVNLPLFGTLSAEPSGHDIEQITVIKGGARAVNFDRAGGYSVDSVSKSGKSQFHGEASFQLMDSSMVAALTSGSASRYEQDRSWIVANLGGPVVKDMLYFFGSYYRPERTRQNAANLYGPLPDYTSTRDEGFGKLTFTPTKALLFNFSYRESKRLDKGDTFASNASATTGTGGEARQRIGTVDGSWVISPRSFATANFAHYGFPTSGTPDFNADVVPSTAVGTRIDTTKLDQLGRLSVPLPVAGATAFNAFIQPLIDRYGYTQNGVKTGGGVVGYGSEFNDQDFFRDAAQVGYNITLGSSTVHDLHVGFQWYKDREELVRRSNGWGLISVPGGRVAAVNGQLPFYTARIQQQSTGQAAPIKSDYVSNSFEINDTIKRAHWTFNLGLLASRDTLFGQGLREDSSTLSGFVSAPGNRYQMYEIPFSKMLQPRIGTTWAYNGKDTVYASYAKYNPAASSLPRAASWDRNLIGTFVDVHFDPQGVAFAAVPVGSSSGKLFVPDMTPRTINEFLIGTAREFGKSLSGRLYARHRRGSHFWEDTNNNARQAFAPPPGIPQDLYIPNLSAQLAQIGSGSTYVITELDGSYTRYYEATLEMDWHASDNKTWLRGSYTWSRYYGNFDQDNSTTANDANVFIGSSNIGDGAGRQLWDFKDGTLRGDRPHLLKLLATRVLPWKASFGVFGVAQSGQPWETWSFVPYAALTTSTSTSNRYAEKAGSRRSDAHWQIDLNYTQTIKLNRRINFQIGADLFNVFNEQTGYNITPDFNSSTFGQPRNYFDPRRLQVVARLRF